MVFEHHFVSAENELVFVITFFAATIVSNLFDKPVFFLNNEKIFLVGIRMYNRYRRN